MVWLTQCFYFVLGCVFMLIMLATLIVALPFIIVSFICLLTPPPFTMLVNLIFPIFFFMGPNGARKFFDGLLSLIRFFLDKAIDCFRTARHATV
jgi:hypothetical protein